MRSRGYPCAYQLSLKVGDVEELNKTEALNVRISEVQKQRLAEAAQIVSLERGELVDPTTLARELIVAGADEIRGRSKSEDQHVA